MSKTQPPRKQALLELLALEDIGTRLSLIRVPSDSLNPYRFLGSLALVLVALLFISGAALTFYYSPYPGAAYDSVDYSQFTMPFGGILRGVHYWSWNILLLVMILHMGRGFLNGAYKGDGRMTWVSGAMLLLVLPAFLITGDLLPWDQKAYWTTKVREGIIGSVPVAGDFILHLLEGGPRTGIVALTRFYVLHIIFVPALFCFLLAAHFHLLARKGLSEPLHGTKGRHMVHFFPTIVNRWLVLFILTTVTLGAISHYWSAPLGAPADPTDSGYVPMPEWWVLFLNQLVTIFSGSLSAVGTVVIPSGLAILLLGLPFLDRSSGRNLQDRKGIVIIMIVVAIGILALSVMGYIGHHLAPHG